MFESGEVDYLVATDAIGMGLNLDVTHVAFASLRKFDGHASRELDPAELAQIAGRAGRHLTDGTFGTVAPVTLRPEVTASMELHRFPPVRRIQYRNTDLDFDSLDGLMASLQRPAPKPCLRLVGDRDDTAALRALSKDPLIRNRARGSEMVRMLWEVCQVPDFRKLLLEAHVLLLAEVFQMLAGPKGRIDPGWLADHLDAIDQVDGDIDTLIAHLASIRTFTFITQKARYVDRAALWQDRAREIEDRLSDALHQRLVQRFVEHGGTARRAARRRRHSVGAEPDDDPPSIGSDHPFAPLLALRARVWPTAKLAASPGSSAWVEAVIAAPHERFALSSGGSLTHNDLPVGKLTRGTSLLLPDVRLGELADTGPGARSRLLRRLVAFVRDWVAELPQSAAPGRARSHIAGGSRAGVSTRARARNHPRQGRGAANR